MKRAQPLNIFTVFILLSAMGSRAQPNNKIDREEGGSIAPSAEAARLEQVERLRKLRDTISVPIIRQQICFYNQGESKVVVIRKAVNLDTGDYEELHAEFPYPTDSYDPLFRETAMDVALNSHLVSGCVGQSRGWRYRMDADTGGTWRMDFMGSAPQESRSCLSQEYLRLTDYPDIKWRMHMFEEMAAEAQQQGDAETEQFFRQEIQAIVNPGPYYETRAFVQTNAQGRLFRAFFQDDKHAVHIGPEGLIRSITVTSPNGQILRRVDNRFVSDHDFAVPPADRIGDIYPFFDSRGGDIKERRQFKCIGIKFARVGGEWVVTFVLRESPAEVAGVRKGDILREINHTGINGAGLDLVNSLFDTGDQVTLSIQRGEEAVSVSVRKRDYVWLYPVDLPPPFK